jgi:hypothetical protein
VPVTRIGGGACRPVYPRSPVPPFGADDDVLDRGLPELAGLVPFVGLPDLVGGLDLVGVLELVGLFETVGLLEPDGLRELVGRLELLVLSDGVLEPEDR